MLLLYLHVTRRELFGDVDHTALSRQAICWLLARKPTFVRLTGRFQFAYVSDGKTSRVVPSAYIYIYFSSGNSRMRATHLLINL